VGDRSARQGRVPPTGGSEEVPLLARILSVCLSGPPSYLHRDRRCGVAYRFDMLKRSLWSFLLGYVLLGLITRAREAAGRTHVAAIPTAGARDWGSVCSGGSSRGSTATVSSKVGSGSSTRQRASSSGREEAGEWAPSPRGNGGSGTSGGKRGHRLAEQNGNHVSLSVYLGPPMPHREPLRSLKRGGPSVTGGRERRANTSLSGRPPGPPS
jgi:hypothetical protein